LRTSIGKSAVVQELARFIVNEPDHAYGAGRRLRPGIGAAVSDLVETFLGVLILMLRGGC
jgi:hypothetical protein